MDADADRVTPYVFWQLSPDDDQYVDILAIVTSNPPGQVSNGGLCCKAFIMRGLKSIENQRIVNCQSLAGFALRFWLG